MSQRVNSRTWLTRGWLINSPLVNSAFWLTVHFQLQFEFESLQLPLSLADDVLVRALVTAVPSVKRLTVSLSSD